MNRLTTDMTDQHEDMKPLTGAISAEGCNAVVGDGAAKRRLKRGELAALTDTLPFQKESAAQAIRAMRDSDRY